MSAKINSRDVAKRVTKTVKSRTQSNVVGFVDFVRTQGVVGLAIGFVMGVQSKALIDQLSSSFIDPLLGLLIGGNQSLSNKTWYVEIGSRSAIFSWGAFAYIVINFLMVAAVIYFIFKWLGLEKLDKKKV